MTQYPYPKQSHATGLALSPGVRNYRFHDQVLFKALEKDRKLPLFDRRPPAADLTRWATVAGVLLLNASLQDVKAEELWKPFLTKVIGAVCAAAERARLAPPYTTFIYEACELLCACTHMKTDS